MRYHLVTLGCAKNTADSLRLERGLRHARHRPAATPDEADLLLVNTCGFIDAAREESLAAVAGIDAARRPGQRLFVVGCLTEIAEEEVRRAAPGVDAAFGVEAWDAVAAAIGPAAPGYDIPQPAALPIAGADGAAAPSAYLKISDGCDRPCTFCIIPAIKGRMRSRPAAELVAEARALAAAGVRELVLVAQDSTAYGEDRGERDGLAALLERLAGAVPEVPWIRLMYAYPGRVTPRLAETMARLPNVLPYLDMPLQHGSPAVLRRMRRPGLPAARRSLAALRGAMPQAALRTTFIVGYPGETEEEFAELLAFVEEQRFDHVGAFVYSPQAGTTAADTGGGAPPPVPPAVAAERYGRLMRLAQEIALARNRGLVGSELDVLVESAEPGVQEDGAPFAVGRSARDAPEVDGLAFVRGEFAAGSIVRARVDTALPYDLACTPVAPPA